MDKSTFLKKRDTASKMKWMEGHKEYLKNTQTVRKYGGVPGSGSGKVYNLNANGKRFERKINSPNAKLKRAFRNDEYENHPNNFTRRALAKLNRK